MTITMKMHCEICCPVTFALLTTEIRVIPVFVASTVKAYRGQAGILEKNGKMVLDNPESICCKPNYSGNNLEVVHLKVSENTLEYIALPRFQISCHSFA